MERRASGAVILAGVLWGVINLFVKTLAAAGLDSQQISFVRILVAAVVFTVFLLIRDRSKFRVAFRDLWMFIGTGIVSLVFFNTAYFYTMIHGQASIAVVLLYTSPVFVMLLSAVFFKERITGRKILALVLTIAGCVCVAGLIGGSYTLTPFVLGMGILSGFLYALYTIFGRFALEKYDSFTVTEYTFVFALIGSAVFADVKGTVRVIASDPVLILWIAGIGVICTILPYLCYTWGLTHVDAGKAAILVAVEPLVGAVLGMTVFRESHDLMKLAGICLILAAILLLQMREKEKR